MAAPEAWRGPPGAQGSTGGCSSSDPTLQSLCSHLFTCPTPVSLSFYFSFLIPGPSPPCSGIGKWHKFPLSLLKMGSNCLGPEGSTRAVPHLLLWGWSWSSHSGCTGGDFAELEQKDGAGGDPKRRGTQTHSCHQPHGRKQESLLDSPSTYLEKLKTRWIFLTKTGAQFLLSSLTSFSSSSGSASMGSMVGLWPSRRRGWCAGLDILVPVCSRPLSPSCNLVLTWCFLW